MYYSSFQIYHTLYLKQKQMCAIDVITCNIIEVQNLWCMLSLWPDSMKFKTRHMNGYFINLNNPHNPTTEVFRYVSIIHTLQLLFYKTRRLLVGLQCFWMLFQAVERAGMINDDQVGETSRSMGGSEIWTTSSLAIAKICLKNIVGTPDLFKT